MFSRGFLYSLRILSSLQGKSSADSPSVAESEGADDQSVTPSEMSRRKKYANKTKEYLEEKIPKERREQAIWRLKKMVIEIQGHADCQYQDENPWFNMDRLLTILQTSKPLRLC